MTETYSLINHGVRNQLNAYVMTLTFMYHNINITYKKRYGNVSIIVYFKILAYMFVRKLCI